MANPTPPSAPKGRLQAAGSHRTYVKPRNKNKKRLAIIFGVAALGITGYLQRENIAQMADNALYSLEMATAEETTPAAGIDAAGAQRMRQAGKDFSAIYDSQLGITYDAATKAVTRAPLYNDFEALATELGQKPVFDRFYTAMQTHWTGNPVGSGNIYSATANPAGTLAGYGGTNDFARLSQVRMMDDRTAGFFDQLRAATTPAQFDAALANHSASKTWLDGAAQRRTLYLATQGQGPDNAGARSTLAASAEMREFSTLMPANGRHSQAFITLRAVFAAMPDMGIPQNVDTLGHLLLAGKTDDRSVCQMATMWRDAVKSIEINPLDLNTAIDAVQARENANNTGINVRQSLMRGRDIAARTAVAAQENARGPVSRMMGFHGCNAG